MKVLPKIVFFGSGPVASATLAGILPHFAIEAVITKPRAPGHRGSVPVLEFAAAHHFPVFTPTTKKELDAVFASQRFASQIGIVVDYGIIISRTAIDTFPKGIVNSHFSLLPHWRGADPITFSILSGQPETAGVSLMLINEKLDEGELLAQKPFQMPPTMTTPELTQALTAISNDMLTNIVPKYLAGTIRPYPQPPIQPSFSRKLTKEDGILDISKPAPQLVLEVRAFAGWPKSKLTLFGHAVIVKKARLAANQQDGTLVLPCGSNTFLEVLELTAPSGKTMSGAEFMRGYKK